MSRRKRSTYEEQSIIAWMKPGETNAQAKARLDALWKKGEHPAQPEKKHE